MNLKKYVALGVLTALLMNGAACSALTKRSPDAMLGAMIMCRFEGTEPADGDPFPAHVRTSWRRNNDLCGRFAVRK